MRGTHKTRKGTKISEKTMRRILFYIILIILFGISHLQGSEPKEISFDQSQNEQNKSSKSSLYLQFNISGLFSRLTDWKDQNPLPNGTHPSSNFFAFGGEGGYVINKYFQIGIGYEYLFTTKVSTKYATGDQINSTFFYGSLRAGTILESIPELYLFVDNDIGSIAVTDVMENYSGQNFDRIGSTAAYRLMIGAQYYILDNWSIMGETGYLFGKVNKVTVNGQTWPNFSLDLSGFTLRFAVNYHFPL